MREQSKNTTAEATLPLSLVVITLNEEKNIERCLRSFPFASEILVVDSGSQDRTVEIAKGLGARVVIEPWRGYAKQKQFACDNASFDWVLSLDADEALSEEAAKALKVVAEGIARKSSLGSDCVGYELNRRNHYLGRWMRHGGMYPDKQLRFFDRRHVAWSKDLVHEKLLSNGRSGHLTGDILHWSATSLSHQLKTIDQYSDLAAQACQWISRLFVLGK